MRLFNERPSEEKFLNRQDAGQQLAVKLAKFKDQPKTAVLALPRGGVPVGYEISKALNLPLDVFIVRKLGFPGQEELAIGAIASGGSIILHPDLVSYVSTSMLNSIIMKETEELGRRETLFRSNRQLTFLKAKTIILVDDGLATGATMAAAVNSLRQKSPASIVVAVPVAAKHTARQFESIADEFVSVLTPQELFSVGSWYEDFTQTTDEEVIDLIEKAPHLRSAA